MVSFKLEYKLWKIIEGTCEKKDSMNFTSAQKQYYIQNEGPKISFDSSRIGIFYMKI